MCPSWLSLSRFQVRAVADPSVFLQAQCSINSCWMNDQIPTKAVTTYLSWYKLMLREWLMDIFRDGRKVGEDERQDSQQLLLQDDQAKVFRKKWVQRKEEREEGKDLYARQGHSDEWSGARMPAWRKGPCWERRGQVSVGSGLGGEKEISVGRERALELRWLW